MAKLSSHEERECALMSMQYCQGPKCHTYQTKDRIRDRKAPRFIKREEDQASIILVAMRVQCNVKMIGSPSLASERLITSAE